MVWQRIYVLFAASKQVRIRRSHKRGANWLGPIFVIVLKPDTFNSIIRVNT
jgi:hypothetical protein